MHRNSVLLFQKYALPYFNTNTEVLEIGPDKGPSTLRLSANVDTRRWDTLDLSNWLSSTTYMSDSPYAFPLDSDKFDVVVSANVIEHVQSIWLWMRELARVCKPGGCVITINPVSWHYHEAPVDCWRIYPEGMKALSEDAGLSVVLSTWESVEMEIALRWLPASLKTKGRQQQLRPVVSLLRKLGRRDSTASFDTITIAEKPWRRPVSTS